MAELKCRFISLKRRFNFLKRCFNNTLFQKQKPILTNTKINNKMVREKFDPAMAINSVAEMSSEKGVNPNINDSATFSAV